jgi:hypothetical protein
MAGGSPIGAGTGREGSCRTYRLTGEPVKLHWFFTAAFTGTLGKPWPVKGFRSPLHRLDFFTGSLGFVPV